MLSNLGYQGIVTIKTKFHDCEKIMSRHNSGTEELFKLLSKCLAGYDISKEVPVGVDLVDTSSSRNVSVLDHIHLSTGTVYTKVGNHWVTRYTTTIPKKQLELIVSGRQYDLHLCNQNKVVLAKVSLSETDVNQIVSLANDMELLIEWELRITNIEDVVETASN